MEADVDDDAVDGAELDELSVGIATWGGGVSVESIDNDSSDEIRGADGACKETRLFLRRGPMRELLLRRFFLIKGTFLF